MTKAEQYHNVKIATFQMTKNSGRYNGDHFFCLETNQYFICAVSDGLGSGIYAHEASKIAITYIRNNHHQDHSTLMCECNKLLKSTRGIVLSILKVDYENKEISYSNIGNINCIFYSATGVLTRTIPKRGFLCGRQCNFTTQHIPYQPGMRFIIYTDGIKLHPKAHKLIGLDSSVENVLENITNYAEILKDDTTILVCEVHL